ncbi:formate/nitrite transporter family protein [Allopusillimonas ginsengisoli]|nr:formate/nitrite transporter family protein [Allopusillimonas ginsengisoli]
MATKESAGTRSANLEPSEQAQAADRSTPGALVIHKIIRKEGEEALHRAGWALGWSAFAAGLSMGFSFLTQATLQASLPDLPWRDLVASFGYCTGFVIVILGRQQLFTESTLTALLPVLTRPSTNTFLLAMRLWAIVLLANVIGTFLFASLLMIPNVFNPEVVRAFGELAVQTVTNDFLPTLLRAFFAGWLIALMVWILPNAQSARLLTIILITYVVAVCHLSHIIAGSVEASYGVLAGHASISDFFLRFMLPTLLGNILGGVGMVGLLNHAAVASEVSDAPDG